MLLHHERNSIRKCGRSRPFEANDRFLDDLQSRVEALDLRAHIEQRLYCFERRMPVSSICAMLGGMIRTAHPKYKYVSRDHDTDRAGELHQASVRRRWRVLLQDAQILLQSLRCPSKEYQVCTGAYFRVCE